MNPLTVKLIIEDIDLIMKSSATDHDQVIKQLKNRGMKVVKIDDQILLKDVIEIYEAFKHISQFSVAFKPNEKTR